MKKIYHCKRYRYYCNVIRDKYQSKRNTKRIKSKKNANRANVKQTDVNYDTLELNYSNINKIIKDVELLKKKDGFRINFRKLNYFDLGLCLIFTSLLKALREVKQTTFGFRKDLMPKDKAIRDIFIQTGIFEILCGKKMEGSNVGKICILEICIDSNDDFKNILLRISKELVMYSLQQTKYSNNKEAKNKLNKVFEELLLNVKSHSKAKTVYVAGEVKSNILKFAILDSGIGFASSIKERSGAIEKMIDEIRVNYVKMIFETSKERDRGYSGDGFKRGNGTRRLKETIERCNGRLQIVSKRDFYELSYSLDMLKCQSISHKVNTDSAIGTLISFELPISDFLEGVENARI